MQSIYVTWYGHHHLVLLISISKAPAWSPSSPAWHHDLHQCVAMRLSCQLLLLQLLITHSDKVKQKGKNKLKTTLWLLPVAVLIDMQVMIIYTKHDHLIHPIYHIMSLAISHHNMPCRNKLDVLYFVVASFTWLLWATSKNRSYLPKPQR